MVAFSIYIVSCIIEGLLAFYFGEHVFNFKINTKSRILIYIIANGVHCALAFLKLPFINIVSLLLMNFVIFNVCYDCKWNNAIGCSIFLFFMMAISETVANIAFSVNTIDYKHVVNESQAAIFGFIGSKFVYSIIIICCTGYFLKKKMKINYIGNHLVIVSVLLLGAIGVGLTMVPFCFDLNYIQQSIFILLFSSVLILILLIFWLQEYIQTKQEQYYSLLLKQEQIEMANNYNELLLHQDENQRIIIHDIKNHMTTLMDMCETTNIEDVKEYLNSVINMPGLSTSLRYTNNNALNIVISRYKKYCELNDIVFEDDISNTDLNFIESADITALFCNVLDNAVEAAKKVKVSKVELLISSNNNSSITIFVKNSCKNKPNFDKNGTLISNKVNINEHGFGTLSISRVVEKYSGMVDYSYDEALNEFNTIIVLKMAK